MECKVQSVALTNSPAIGFNRNIVECKAICTRGILGQSFVLIETLWNVNNGDPDAGNALRVGFNRNMMECKGRIYQCA